MGRPGKVSNPLPNLDRQEAEYTCVSEQSYRGKVSNALANFDRRKQNRHVYLSSPNVASY